MGKKAKSSGCKKKLRHQRCHDRMAIKRRRMGREKRRAQRKLGHLMARGDIKKGDLRHEALKAPNAGLDASLGATRAQAA